MEHKINVIKSHCKTFNRDFNEIMITTNDRITKDTTKESLIDNLSKLHKLGVNHAHFSLEQVYDLKILNMLISEVIPAVKDWN